MRCTRSAVWRLASISLVSPFASGCMRAPSFNVLGSYFPGWIACIVAGVMVSAGLRLMLKRTGIEERLPMLPIFYFSVTLLIACVIWLISFE